MNRETLKQAIADAKTIKETAIANAKLALEEAFTPQLTAMFAEKLNEMDKEEVKEEESVEENYSMEEEGLEENFNIDEILAELDGIDEYAEEQPDRDMDGDGDVDADDVKMMKEEDLMLEEMSDEDIEELVTQVIDDMIASGKLMAGEGEEEEEDMEDMEDAGMEDMEDMEDMEGEEDIDEMLAELLAEADDIEEEINEEEMVNEAISPEIAAVLAAFGLPVVAASVAKLSDMAKDGKLGSVGKSVINFLEKAGKATAPRNTGGGDLPEAKEMEETINELRNELNEVNLLNAKLLYTNKIFKAKNLTESDKVKVLNAFDKAADVKGVKLVYETLTESLKTTSIIKKSPVKESLGSASRTIAPATPKQPIVEVSEAFARMQKIAGIRK